MMPLDEVSGRIACAKQNNFASGGHVNIVERFIHPCIKQFIFVGLTTMISTSARHMVPEDLRRIYAALSVLL